MVLYLQFYQLLKLFSGKLIAIDQSRSKRPADLMTPADLVGKDRCIINFDLIDRPQGLFDALHVDMVCACLIDKDPWTIRGYAALRMFFLNTIQKDPYIRRDRKPSR